MSVILSNQPRLGEKYFGVRLFKDGKNVGSHNGINSVKNIQYFQIGFFNMFIAELKEKCLSAGITCNVVEKQF